MSHYRLSAIKLNMAQTNSLCDRKGTFIIRNGIRTYLINHFFVTTDGETPSLRKIYGSVGFRPSTRPTKKVYYIVFTDGETPSLRKILLFCRVSFLYPTYEKAYGTVRSIRRTPRCSVPTKKVSPSTTREVIVSGISGTICFQVPLSSN